jgi:hypothetical protein
MKKSNGWYYDKNYEIFPMQIHFKDKDKKERLQSLLKLKIMKTKTEKFYPDIILRAIEEMYERRIAK